MASDDDISIKLSGYKNIKLIYPTNLETDYTFEDEILTFRNTRRLIARVFELDK